MLFALKATQKDESKGELYRVPTEGGAPEKFGLEISGFIMNLSAHPDGRQIAFSSSEQDVEEINRTSESM